MSQQMSLDSALDEEREAVLRILTGQAKQAPGVVGGGRSASPMGSVFEDSEIPPSSVAPVTGQSPPRRHVQPVRSMLDVDSPPPPAPPVRSMLDIGSSSTPTAAQPVFSAQSSPTEANHRVLPQASQRQRHHHSSSSGGGSGSLHVRSMSDASSRPVDFGPRFLSGRNDRVDPTASYQFSDIITNLDTPTLARRTPQVPAPNSAAAKRLASSMAEVIRNSDISNLKIPGGLQGRGMRSRSRVSGSQSKSPHNRLAVRSKSPGVNLSHRNMSPGGRAFFVDNSEEIDIQNAYRRLSDANLARAGGTLGELPMRKRSEETGAHGSRLTKDYVGPDGQELLEDSSDDNHSSEDEDETQRGRKVARSFPDEKYPSSSNSPVSTRQDARLPHSMLAAAEEERIQVASSAPAFQYRSLLDEPEITVTNPSGEKIKPSKPAVHPSNSFELNSRSMSRTPWDSDDEAEYTDIKRAQKLPLTMTPIMSNPQIQRSIRIIYRGDLAKVQKEATEEEHRRIRKYLVATDLSDESTHALEWTVGTVLRDGDTLIAIYCADEELGIPGAEGQDELRTTREQAAAVSAMTSMGRLPDWPSLSSLGGSSSVASNTTLGGNGANGSGSGGPRSPALMRNTNDQAGTAASSPAPLTREKSRMEEDRHRAVQEITDRITRLLRKTRLQVRVIVEVLHCKTPRHLITEVIDLVNPTLVILGSRGRSALKGVILGSFSNYLVTKSSVPVMVARKRLRKGKFQRASVSQQVNNLNNIAAKSLVNAKID